jgi:LCP family protein required for cell wall assembly
MTERAEAARPHRHSPVAAGLLMFALTLFVGGGLFSGWVFLTTVRALLAGNQPPARLTVLKVTEIVTGQGAAARPTAVSRQAPSLEAAPPGALTTTSQPEAAAPVWDGKDRVTVLLLGIDQRDDEKGLPTRSDTMILVSIDPLNLTGSMLSIPRDLWVPLPACGSLCQGGQGKLNSAHFYGELEKPGSGPQAARRAIQYNIGVPINYTARVDFRGFERLIDALGGISVDVDRAILDDEYPNEEYGISRLFITAGPQRMNGQLALRYARSRHSDSDFGRIRRQQKVLQSAREEALRLGIVTRLPSMVGIINSSVVTDIPFGDLWALANLGRQIPSGAIASRYVDDSMIIDANGDGTVLVPDREKVRRLVQELFYDPVVKKEAARVEVLNGTARDGLATGLRATLQGQAFNVVSADSADRADYKETLIVDHRGKKATAARLAQLLGVPVRNLRSDSGAASGADVTIVIGADFRGVS